MLHKRILYMLSAAVCIFGFSVTADAGTIQVTSPAFKNGKAMPVKFAFDQADIAGAKNTSPPLKWKVSKKDAPKINSFAISIVDLHPIAEKWGHLYVMNIPRGTGSVKEGAFSVGGTPPTGSFLFQNTFGSEGYGGPAPPPGSGPHIYEITVYGLSTLSTSGADPATTFNGGKYGVQNFLNVLGKKYIVAKGKMKGLFTMP